MNNNIKEVSVSESRKIQLEILTELDRYCAEHNIDYFIIAGTLLGAVRHRGYIPWDDDIDVVMLRKDYESLKKEYLSKRYYIASCDTIKGYTLPFIKLCKTGTLTYEIPNVINCDLGINIDIFPIDNVPDNSEAQDKILKANEKYKYILGLKWNIPSQRNSMIIRIIRKCLSLFLKCVSYKYLINAMNKNASKYNHIDTNLCSEVVWGCGKREFVSKHAFKETIELVFEGRKFKAPLGWEEWLSNRYGEYMILPPLDKQVSHHNRKDYILG